MNQYSQRSCASQASSEEAAENCELEEFFSQQDLLSVVTVDWHTSREQGLTAREEEEFQRWLADSPAHLRAFEALNQNVASLRAIPTKDITRFRAGYSSTQSNEAIQAPSSSHANPKRKWVNLRGSGWLASRVQGPQRAWAAFCCVALLAAGFSWHYWERQRVFSHRYVVERGQIQNITLPDGTELAFDTDTQAHVALDRDHRELRIQEGQIMLTVAPDSTKPFVVLAGPARITVVGTQFSVRYRRAGMDANTVKVAVKEGHVRVADMSEQQSAAQVDLVAGQGLTVLADGTISQVSRLTPGSIAPWKRGLMRFENTPLGDALMELERYGPTKLTIHDPVVAAMPIGGSFKIDHPEAFAQMVTQILPVQLLKDAAGKTEITRKP